MAKKATLGDIFEANVSKGKRYFQFIGIDQNQMDSEVIRVFKKIYESTQSPTIDEIIEDDVETFLHTYTFLGLKDGSWTKIGNSKDVGDLSIIKFRSEFGYIPGDANNIFQYRVWKMDDPELPLDWLDGNISNIRNTFDSDVILTPLVLKRLNNEEISKYGEYID
jgi:hypothetical protein